MSNKIMHAWSTICAFDETRLQMRESIPLREDRKKAHAYEIFHCLSSAQVRALPESVYMVYGLVKVLCTAFYHGIMHMHTCSEKDRRKKPSDKLFYYAHTTRNEQCSRSRAANLSHLHSYPIIYYEIHGITSFIPFSFVREG